MRRWEGGRRWLCLGLTIQYTRFLLNARGPDPLLTPISFSIATDINLDRHLTAKPINQQHASEMLNRTRVGLNLFQLDRSTGSEHGKLPTIKNGDYVADHSEKWWESPHNLQHYLRVQCRV